MKPTTVEVKLDTEHLACAFERAARALRDSKTEEIDTKLIRVESKDGRFAFINEKLWQGTIVASEKASTLEPNGEQLIRDLAPGEYEICGRGVIVDQENSGDKNIRVTPDASGYLSWFEPVSGEWAYQEDFERYIGKLARNLTADDIVRIEPKTGTALLDELEPGTIQNINGVPCSVELAGDWIMISQILGRNYLVRHTEENEWQYFGTFSKAINKPVADLVASDIVQLYPKEA